MIEEPKANILVVDDTPANLRLLTKLLSDSSYEVRAAPNGNLALKTVEQAKLPDLILLDIMMPGMDGYEVCRHLKESERSRDIPVIFISALNDTMDKVKAFQLGGVDYLTKPFEPEEVLARVKTHLTLSRMQKRLESQNVLLQQEMVERQRVAEELQKAHDELELRVQQRTQELEEARHTAELANQTKTAFFANVSHELRTPLNIILGSTYVLATNYQLTMEQQITLNTIQQSGNYLLTLINDILDISHIETNQIELHPVEIHLNKFLQDLVTNFAQQAAQKRLAFAYEPLSPLPVGISADEKRLRQVLINLLSNAVKFTDRGGITFKIKSERLHDDQKDSSAGLVQLSFEVIDTGLGIAETHLNRIFLPFEQVRDWKQKTAGLGLGLSITQKLVELMGGKLSVESTLGKGSKFWCNLTFPEAFAWLKSPLSAAATIIGYEGPRRKILVVDDHPENCHVIEGFLAPLDFEVITANDGAEGLEKALQHLPDLVITDLVMPVMDGFELMRHLRRQPAFQHLPIVAESASVMKCSSFGGGVLCNAFLSKPFHHEKLLELLQEHLHLTWRYQSLPTEVTVPTSTLDEEAEFSAPVKVPSPVQVAQLFELALLGDFFGILDLIDHFEQEEVELRPFLVKIRLLAKQFDEVRIHELLRPYLPDDYQDSW